MGDTLPEKEDSNSSDAVSLSVLSDFGDGLEVTWREVIDEEERDADDEDDSPKAKRIR